MLSGRWEATQTPSPDRRLGANAGVGIPLITSGGSVIKSTDLHIDGGARM